jgi:hypothetical protein
MASTKTLLTGAKKIEFAQLALKDKKSFKILFTLSRSDKWAKIPLASAQDADTLKTFSIDLETLLRVAFALSKEQNIYIYTESVKDDDGSHTEYFVHKLDDGETVNITDETFGGKVLKGDIIRPSSAKTTSASSTTSANKKSESKTSSNASAKTSEAKEEEEEEAEKIAIEAKKDAEYIDAKAKRIVAEIEKILPAYCRIEKSKFNLLSTEIVKIIKKQFDC